MFNHFISRVRNNLHVVLCMSPVGDAFRTRCRMFPSLVNCCTIDWFTEWPRSVHCNKTKWFPEGPYIKCFVIHLDFPLDNHMEKRAVVFGARVTTAQLYPGRDALEFD